MSRILAILATAAAMTLSIAGCSPSAPSPAATATTSLAPADGGVRDAAPLAARNSTVPTLPSESRASRLVAADIPGEAKAVAATDLIEKITVKIEVGAGADLEEPIALDLGLGYPLWLYPVGRKADDPRPRGAIPPQTTAKEKIAAGDSATFTFTTQGDDGQDKFRTSQQLLANTRLADIVRVGFAGKGTNNWVLAGYEVKINDKPFAAGKPNVNTGDRATATKRLSALAVQIAPLNQVRNDLLALLQANQLEAKDKTQLVDVLAKLRPLVRESASAAASTSSAPRPGR
jgi:hypothetical protein